MRKWNKFFIIPSIILGFLAAVMMNVLSEYSTMAFRIVACTILFSFSLFIIFNFDNFIEIMNKREKKLIEENKLMRELLSKEK